MTTRPKELEPRPFLAHRVAEFEKRLSREPGPCWLWQGLISKSGYGIFNYDRRQGWAHRFSYENHNGSIDDALLVLHTCDVRRCVNPGHLYLGTPADNTADMMRRGRNWNPVGEEHPSAIITDDQAREIVRRYVRGYDRIRRGNARQLSEEFGISQSHVCALVRAAAAGRSRS
jgi:hypothetical protein